MGLFSVTCESIRRCTITFTQLAKLMLMVPAISASKGEDPRAKNGKCIVIAPAGNRLGG